MYTYTHTYETSDAYVRTYIHTNPVVKAADEDELCALGRDMGALYKVRDTYMHTYILTQWSKPQMKMSFVPWAVTWVRYTRCVIHTCIHTY